MKRNASDEESPARKAVAGRAGPNSVISLPVKEEQTELDAKAWGWKRAAPIASVRSERLIKRAYNAKHIQRMPGLDCSGERGSDSLRGQA